MLRTFAEARVIFLVVNLIQHLYADDKGDSLGIA
jgi:hypothetical protein